MKKIIKILISVITAAIALVGFADVALAAGPLTVIFSSTPLFSETNFVPGNEVDRTVQVSNNSGEAKNVIIEAINATDRGGLGDKLNLVIKDGDSVLYDGKLGAFLRAGEVPLSRISDGGTATYLFNVLFESDADDNYQDKTLGFDLCVGFEGGEMHCGDTSIGGEENTGGGGSGGGAEIGGSGGGSIRLVIFNEEAADISTTAAITWQTNILSTSQVIYGPADGSYVLNLIPPNFGYPSFTAEDSIKVINHSVLLTGLSPGTYKYRVVSRASPPTIGYERKFTVSAPSSPIVSETGPAEPVGEILGASSENSSTSPEVETAGELGTGNLAAAFTAARGNWLWIFILLILIAALGLYYYRRYYR